MKGEDGVTSLPPSLMFSLKLDSLCSFPDLEERVGVLPPLLIEAIGLHFTPLSSERSSAPPPLLSPCPCWKNLPEKIPRHAPPPPPPLAR